MKTLNYSVLHYSVWHYLTSSMEKLDHFQICEAACMEDCSRELPVSLCADLGESGGILSTD